MSYRVGLSCPWCHTMNDLSPVRATYCTDCGHAVDKARMHCDCPKCVRVKAVQVTPTQDDLSALDTDTA